ncbi:FtsX-like permease family protein [Paenibacillus sp. J2TS4]|uniref:FtsX-like permease family protein n=1 Tax=Paenibacillus sp. J2TS4 TaxID=2807194 RepID=UPI001B01C055|nr:FtsX-like permease family protein [Paenibacillus sp. J2TS4]GIP30976.1 hypothetical protein J2TS4_01860 [Paenibacillus sp. J2TS4]
MKLLILVQSRIKQHIENNRAAFIFYLLASIACSIILLYVYGNTIPALKAVTGNNMFYRSYQISLHNTAEVDLESFNQMVADWPFQGELSDPEFIFQKKISEEDYSDAIVQVDYRPPYLEAEYSDDLHLYPVKGDVQFNKEQISSAPPPIILPNMLKLKDPSTTSFHIGTNQYEIIGFYSGFFSVIIPYEIFLEQYSEPDFISVRFPSSIENAAKSSEIMSYLQKYFPAAFIHPPYSNKIHPIEMTLIVMSLGILYALALSSISYLSKYIFEKNRKTNTIYRMTGCSNKMLIAIGFAETVVLALGCTMVSIGLHSILYRSIFLKLNLTEGIDYRFTDYLLMAVIMVLVAVILYLPKIRQITKETIQQNRAK